MVKSLNDCIVACENCVIGCLEMKSPDCVSDCIVCERVCKALKVSMKCGINNELLECLINACNKSCDVCISSCKGRDMKCCRECVKKCRELETFLAANLKVMKIHKTKSKSKSKSKKR